MVMLHKQAGEQKAKAPNRLGALHDFVGPQPKMGGSGCLAATTPASTAVAAARAAGGSALKGGQVVFQGG